MSEEQHAFPNALEATLLIVVLFGLQILIASILLSFESFAALDPWGLSGLITVLGNGVLFIALLAYKKLTYAELFHPARHSVVATMSLLMIPIVLLVPGLVVTAGTLNSIVVKFLPMTPDEQAVLEAMVSNDVLAIVFGCIAAPFLEEMLFRGIILRSFLTQYSRTTAIVGSSLLFAIAHLNVYQFITAFTVGIVAGWLYERTRSLWPCILLHAGYNAFVAYAHTFFNTNVTGDFSATFYASAFVLGIIASAVLMRMLTPAKK